MFHSILNVAESRLVEAWQDGRGRELRTTGVCNGRQSGKTASCHSVLSVGPFNHDDAGSDRQSPPAAVELMTISGLLQEH